MRRAARPVCLVVVLLLGAMPRAAFGQSGAAADSAGPGVPACVDTTVTPHRWTPWTRTGALLGAAVSGAAVAVAAFQARHRDATVGPEGVVLPMAAFVGASAAVGWGAGWIGYDLVGRRHACPSVAPAAQAVPSATRADMPRRQEPQE